MTIFEAMLAVVDALEGAQVPYMLTGSLASMFYGISRSTLDADFVVQLGGTPLRELIERLPPDFRLDPQLGFETVGGSTRYLLNVTGTPLTVELFELTDDAHDQARFGRRRQATILGRQLWLPTAEDVIITKLRWLRRKDADDIRDVISVQEDMLDWTYIDHWCEQHDTGEALDSLRRESSGEAPDAGKA